MPNEDPILALQREYNRRTSEGWASYADHRRRVTKMLLAAMAEFGPRLCVLGAGNCNDLELAALSETFERLTLVDLDEEALERGVARQKPARTERVTLVKSCDISGVAAIIRDWRPEIPASDNEIDACLRRLEAPIAEPIASIGSGKYDVVASTCLLTQMIESLRTTLGADHPRFIELLIALRHRHWRLLSSLCRTGGRVFLFTDFVSSDTAPEIAATGDGEIGDSEIRDAAQRLIERGNFFTGANPFSLRQELLADGVVSPLFARVELLTPWRWRLESRAYLVAAIRAVVR